MNLNTKNIFLIDGIGAVVSALATGLVLPLYAEAVGLSAQSLYLLGSLALIFAVYSLTCFWMVKSPHRLLLGGIIVANIFYGLLAASLGLLVDGLSAFGRFYFISEALVILGLVVIEFRVYSKKTN